jgi:undecaprenyl-diphosphatase
MNIFQSFLLGVLQGLTEFLPVSSTAHLLIGQKLLGIPSSGAMFSFLVIVQLGTIVSLVIYFWKDLWKILRATISSVRNLTKGERGSLDLDARLGWFILISTIPALLAGFLLKDAVEALFRTPFLEAAIRLLSAAVLMTLAEGLTKRSRHLDSMTWLDALIVGLFQVLAVFPGASRSGTTISAGMFRGFERKAAARFAFLMSIPVMIAAGAYEMLTVVKMPDLGGFLPVLVVGFVTAAVIGWFAVKWLLNFLAGHSLYVFAIYCSAVGALCLIVALR